METMSSATGSTPLDFSVLASQSLLSLGDQTVKKDPLWQLSLGELKVASAESIHKDPIASQDRGWGAAHLNRLPRNAELGPNRTSAIEPNDGKDRVAATSVYDYLAEHQQSILDHSLMRERLETRRKSQRLVEDHIEEDWNRERNRWLMEVAEHTSLGRLTSTTAPGPPTGSTESRDQLLLGQDRASAKDRQLVSHPTTECLDSETVKSHVGLVAKLNRSTHSRDIFSDFQRIASIERRPASPREIAYGTAWRLLQSMVSHPKVTPLSSPMGALSHFCHQFQTHATSRVRAATLAGHDMSRTRRSYDRASLVTDYVNLEVGSTASPWSLVYYSLRCGDANQALNVVIAHGDKVEPVVQRVLSRLAHVQSSASCIWDSQVVPVIPEEDRQKLVDMYHRAKTHEPGNSYLLASLGLLSLAEPITSSEVVKTVEDYMFGVLWDAVQSSQPMAEIAKVGNEIARWGPSHFDESEDSGGWAFSLPLLAVQCYHTALTHLVQTGGSLGLLQATHLSLVLAHSGIKLLDHGQHEAPSACILTTMLVSYSNVLKPVDVPAALEYLVRIPDNGRKRREIALLVVESRQFELLGGTNDTGESSAQRALRANFPGTVSSLLADAAEEAVSRGNVKDAAELLFLAGRYSALLMLLNKQLASQLGCSPNPEQTFWLQAAHQFQSLHLSKGRTRVLEVLETENKLDLVSNLQLLMDLTTFVGHTNNGDFEAGLSLVDKLSLLPTSDAEISLKLKQFTSLDSVVEDSFSAVLLGTMQSLFELHSRLKLSSQGLQSASSASALSQRLGELRNRARLLVLFSGLLQMPNDGDLNVRLAQMEAHMT